MKCLPPTLHIVKIIAEGGGSVEIWAIWKWDIKKCRESYFYDHSAQGKRIDGKYSTVLAFICKVQV